MKIIYEINSLLPVCILKSKWLQVTQAAKFLTKLQIFCHCGYIGCHLQGGVQVPTGGKPQGKPTSL